MSYKNISYSEVYRNALFNDVIPFWEKYSIDPNGGYYTCLDKDGNCFDADKFIWLQARQVWTFSMLFNRVEERQTWMDIAQHGISFLDQKAFDQEGNCYFSTDPFGKPTVAAYNIFSDCFVTMAYSEYFKASGIELYKEKALVQFRKIISRAQNPKGKYNKLISETRPLKNFALPMIMANLSLELEGILPEKELEDNLDQCVDLIMNQFVHPEEGVLMENVGPSGEIVDSFDGRLVNPGHGLEACWFLIDIAERRGDKKTQNRLVEIMLKTLEFGWDKSHEGIFYFMDIKGHPTQQLEWNQKLWWVHLEALVALAKALNVTDDPRVFNWFEKLHNYTFSHFPDKRGGYEWYGYLSREGTPLLDLKGGKWKGCFHVPRALFYVYKELINHNL